MTIVGSFLAHSGYPVPCPSCRSSGVASVVLTYAVLSVPFTFSGIVVALALTRFPRQVSALYARRSGRRRAGMRAARSAAAGHGRTDGDRSRRRRWPRSAAVLFAAGEAGCRARSTVRTAAFVAAAAVASLARPGRHRQYRAPRGTIAAWLRLVWVKGQLRGAADRRALEPLLADSRDRRSGEARCRPSGWGFSTTLPPDADRARAAPRHRFVCRHRADGVQRRSRQRSSTSSTTSPTSPTTSGRPPSVVVVGTGGGRDILSALVFDQRAVTGVEINPSILELVNGRFGDFTGHLDRDPRVRFVNDEARSYLARMQRPRSTSSRSR